MATAEAGGSPQQPHVPMEVHRNSQPSTSFSPSNGSDGLHPNLPAVCRWRTARYHDQECSRYFDCPSHTVERALSDGGHGREHEEQQDMEPQDDQPVSPLSEEGSESEDTLRARSPSPDVPVAAGEATNTSMEAPRIAEEGPERGSSGPSSTSPAFLVNNQPLRIRPRAGSARPEATGNDSGDGGGGMPRSPGPVPMRRSSGVLPRSQLADRPAAGPASPTRLVSGPSPSPSTPAEHSSPSEVVLPRWQPDSEVTYCPFCGTQFSFFVRKHHCRKCGRVVCNSCSPHRITIPYQFIVRPPGVPPPVPQSGPLSLLDSQGWYPGFGGGEKVRLCNPCVPDPNTAPPQAQAEPARTQNNPRPRVQTDNNPPSYRWGVYFASGLPQDAQLRGRSVTVQPGTMSSPQPHFPPTRSAESRILWGTPPVYHRSPTTSQTPHLYSGIISRYRSTLDAGDRGGPSTMAGPSSSSSTSTSRRLPHAFAPRPQIPEEDECPVCHRELPPRTLPNFESLREAHINNCITAHSRYGGRGGGGSSTSTGATLSGGEDELPPVPARRTGMFPYTATEKDCVDSAECSICLEEFEVGVAMARLECLCRFHRACINAWWERHPGRCPMHQHDGFGY
ncbi:hypothetical protein C8A03DRAFT_45286 [Achaetomium macrosporum]|uniref:FYVE-domain-containing protein n=1 Tax=Achaetomium macrosporum TaxID=79813 RepID=A0AAN7C7B3_9PEZI|nr:hypothetical protein C8A03DRAFT_45286 [Achaetomium macrosporum]